MDFNSLLQQGGLTALGGLALYLVKVIVNDLKHDMAASRASLERQEKLLERILVQLKGDISESR